MGEAGLSADSQAITPAGCMGGMARFDGSPGCCLVGEGGLQQQGLQLWKTLQHDILQGLAHLIWSPNLWFLPLLICSRIADIDVYM